MRAASGLMVLGCAVAALLNGCGSASEPAPASQPDPVLPPVIGLTRVSKASPYSVGCDGVPAAGTLYQEAEVEPYLVVSPLNGTHLVGVWQQDRWSSGGAHGLAAGVSFDSGASWSGVTLPFSICAGGSAAAGNDFERASDPWLSFSSNGVLYALSLSFTGDIFAANSSSAMLVSRSVDGGLNWGAPLTLQHDGSNFFNDKGAITADPADSRYVYAVWDRLDRNNNGPTYLARSIDGGLSWEAARAIYNPGTGDQTLGNQIVVLGDGTLLLFFTRIDNGSGGTYAATLYVIRSGDRGLNWSTAVKIADALPVPTVDPDTNAPVRDGSLLAGVAAGPANRLAVVWEDARFSGGAHNSIAFSQSGDGGLSWSPPVRINGDPAAPAFTPSPQFNSDGAVGVSYFDFRHNGRDPATLPTDGWLTVSQDGVNWSERRVAGPFDLRLAPNADGFFIGDYHALAHLGADFLLFLAHTNSDAGNRTDVYTQRISASSSSSSAKSWTAIKAAAGPQAVTPELAARVSDNLKRQLREQQPPRRRAAKKR